MIYILKDIGKGKIGFGERQVTKDNLFRLDKEKTVDTNYYVNNATFTDGNITLTRNDGTPIIIPMDGRYLKSFTEQDPTVPQHVKNITTNQISNWNNGYYDDITNIQLTRSVDDLVITMFKRNGDTISKQIKVYTNNITEIPNRSYNDLQNLPLLNISNWNTAYTWGNHSTQGYITGINNITDIPFRSYNDLQDLPDLNAQVSVIDQNLSTDKHVIATVATKDISETVTRLNVPVLSGNILTLKFINENNVEQTVSVDLSNIVTNESGINNATYDAATNIITLNEVDGGTYTIDLSEFSINVATDENGITILTQENEVKLTVSRVGQTGEFSHLLNIPTTIAGYGINNAYTIPQIDGFFNGTTSITGYNKSNWDTAFGWGNHALQGYLTQYQNVAWNGTNGNFTITNGNTINLDGRYSLITSLTSLATNGISVQDELGVEKFVTTGPLKFGNMLFDAVEQTISAPIIPPQTLSWNGIVSGELTLSDSNTINLDDRYTKNPNGLDGQLYFINEDGTSQIIPDYLMKRGIVVDTQAEFDAAVVEEFSLSEVFNNWDMFSHYYGTSTEEQSPESFPALNPNDPEPTTTLTAEEFYNKTAWGYDEVNERIYLTKNYDPYTGFISPKTYSNYVLETTLSSANNDDDQMGLVIGFYKDPVSGFEYTLSILRMLTEASNQGNFTYVLAYNYAQNPTTSPDYNPDYADSSSTIIVDGTALAPFPVGATGWVGNDTRLRVNRSGDIFSIKTSQFGSTVIDDTTEIIIDISTYPSLSMFMGSSQIGFSAKSQKDAYFSDIVFDGFVDYIFYNQNGGASYETWEYDQGTTLYNLQSPKTTLVSDYFGVSRFVHSYLFKKVYYITENDLIIKIGGDVVSQVDFDAHTHTFDSLTDKPTTIAGYGITDAFSESQADNLYVNKTGDTMSGNLLVGTLGAGVTKVEFDVWGGGAPTFSHQGNLTRFRGASSGTNGAYFDIELSTGNNTFIRANTLFLEPSTGLVMRSKGMTIDPSYGIGHGSFRLDINGGPSMYVVGSNSNRRTLFSNGGTSTPQGQVEVIGSNNSLPSLLVTAPVTPTVDVFGVRSSTGAVGYDLFGVDISGNAKANAFIKNGGTSSQFLKADGSVDTTSYVTGVSVVDNNTNLDTHQIATVGGVILKETVTKLNTPTLSGNVLTLSFLNENDVAQTVTVDLSSIVTNQSGINNATYDAASNIITLNEVDGDVWTIDLSEFSIVPNTDAGGITTLTQEGVVKLTVSKVGQTGEWADILNKPTTFTPSSHTHTFASLTSKPTTISGFGITDVYTKPESDGKYVTLGTTQTITGIKTFSNGLVDSPTEIGRTNQTYRNFTTLAEWGLPVGGSRFVQSISFSSPGSAGYWNVTGRRDAAGGYSGIYTPFGGTGSNTNAYIGYTIDETIAPTWDKIWTDRNLINVSQLANDTGYLTPTTGDTAYVKKIGDTMTGSLTATSFIKSGGTASQFLKGDGSVDSTTYYHSGNLTNITQIPNRDYADITGKPILNISNWDTAYNRGDFRDFGLGITTPQGVAISGGNLNSITLANGLYKITASTLNSPIGGEAGVVIVERAGLDNYITQKAQMVNTGDVVKSFVRHYKPGSSTWTPWRRLWTTEDFTSTNVANWTTAYGWGNHSTAGYVITELDPVFSASPSGTITEQMKTNWDTAFGWSNHANAGYLTTLPVHNHFTENDGRYVNVTGDTMTGNLLVQKTSDPDIRAKHTNANSRARVSVENSAGSFINMIITGPSYVAPNFAGFAASGVDMIFVTDEGTPSGGTHDLLFSPGGYANIGMRFKPNHYLGIGAGSANPTEQLQVDNNVLANSFIKRGGLSTQYLKADGSVDTNTYLTGITVTDNNTSITRNQIATIEGTPLYETVGEILVPELTGNILNIKYKDGDGVIQSQPVDLSSLVTTDTSLSNATYDAATNVITLDVDGTPYTIDLSEFSILVSTDAGGITTVIQEGVIKLVVSKVGQTGQWNDILGKPSTFTPSTHNHDSLYVNVTGDTMTGDLILTTPTFGGFHINRSANTNSVIKYSGANGGPYYAGFDVTTGNFGFVATVADVTTSKILLNTNTGNLTASKFIKTGGLSTEFLMADGSSNPSTFALDADVLHKTGDETKTGSLTISKTNTPGETLFDIQGSAGQLFSITDSLEGDLFSVNDISGLPIFTVNSDDLVIIEGDLSIKSGQASGLTADSTLTTVDATTNDAAYFDYFVKREDSTGLRSGTIMVVWDGTTVTYSDTSTNDLGGSTLDISMVADILNGEVRLRAIITAGTWTVKVGTRTL